jgi:DNA-binding MarR family transcriptional regulator
VAWIRVGQFLPGYRWRVGERSEIEVPDDFEREFPGASRSAALVAANLLRTATALEAEIERPPREAVGLSISAFQVLAIIDGADAPPSAQAIAEQLLVTSGSMTSLLDTLERRGLVERRRHPTDRRKILLHLTVDGQRTVDRYLPAIHNAITHVIAPLTEPERHQLLAALAKVRAGVAGLANQTVPAVKARRKRRPSPT